MDSKVINIKDTMELLPLMQHMTAVYLTPCFIIA